MNQTISRIDRPVIGWREWMKFPSWENHQVEAKVDTGARTSAIHTPRFEVFERDGQSWIQFELDRAQNEEERVICESPVIDSRVVRDSGGHEEIRFFVKTLVQMGTVEWEIEISLTNRDNMKYQMLLGRTALSGRFLVDTEKSHLIGHPPRALECK